MADSVLSSDKPSTSSPLDPPSRIICRVCQKQFSQYTCPRCNSRYCSLHCYKSHSLRCTESFMRDNVVAELGQLQPNDEAKAKMLDILKRFHSEEETEDVAEDDSTLSEATLQKLVSEGRIELDDLSANEKKRFERAIASGELSKMIEPWDPWWLSPSAKTISLSREGTQLVQTISNEQSTNVTEIPLRPETPLPPLSKLSSSEPSPLLAVHLVDIIYTYCFVLRLYNGDWRSDAVGSACVVLSVSSVLSSGEGPGTVTEALSYCLEQACSPSFKHVGGLGFALNLIGDVETLIGLGRSALLCSLSDLGRLIQAGEREMKALKPKTSSDSEMRNKLRRAERKVYFITCWVNEQPSDAWSSLAAIARAEKASAAAYYKSGSRNMEKKTENKITVLIEEMDEV